MRRFVFFVDVVDLIIFVVDVVVTTTLNVDITLTLTLTLSVKSEYLMGVREISEISSSNFFSFIIIMNIYHETVHFISQKCL
jgi:hypothetical protein